MIFRRTIRYTVLLLIGFSGFSLSCRQHKADGGNNIPILARVDSLALDQWEIIPNGDVSRRYGYMITKDGWMIRMQNKHLATPEPEMLMRCLKHINNLQPTAVEDVEESKWKDLGVDRYGTQLHIYQQGKLTDELILGKLYFYKDNIARYYVRRKEENTVYSVQYYLDGSLLAPVDKSRWRMLSPIPPKNMQKLHILQANGAQYAIEQTDKGFKVDGRQANTETVLAYLVKLSKLHINEFSSWPQTGAEKAIDISSAEGLPDVSLKAAPKGNGNWIISSSLNLGNYREASPGLIDSLFPPATYFLSPGK